MGRCKHSRMAVLCARNRYAENCLDGPRWFLYMGGTATVRTANVMDYSERNFGLMPQVWSSTLVAMATTSIFQAAASRQTGTPGDLVGEWVAQALMNNVMDLCMLKLFRHSPPIVVGEKVEMDAVVE